LFKEDGHGRIDNNMGREVGQLDERLEVPLEGRFMRKMVLIAECPGLLDPKKFGNQSLTEKSKGKIHRTSSSEAFLVFSGG
jgi:hypothetical protein